MALARSANYARRHRCDLSTTFTDSGKVQGCREAALMESMQRSMSTIGMLAARTAKTVVSPHAPNATRTIVY